MEALYQLSYSPEAWPRYRRAEPIDNGTQPVADVGSPVASGSQSIFGTSVYRRSIS